MHAIQTSHLTKHYGKARGILDLNLAVEQGEFFGFIGPNGAGKSTTIRALLGLIQPSGGSATILGMDAVRERTQILRRVGYLPSESAFYSGMRVRDVLKLSAGLRGMDCAAAAGELCARLQLDPARKVDELSFGNHKKVGIVSALQHMPELLILDAFFSILEERNRAGATVFFSSHELSEIQRHCHRAAIIREGKLIACDRVEALSRAQARRVTVHGCAPVERLTGVRDFQTFDDGASFLYTGDFDALIRALAEGHVRDLAVAEPDLEEIFLHYYAEGGEEA